MGGRGAVRLGLCGVWFACFVLCGVGGGGGVGVGGGWLC